MLIRIKNLKSANTAIVTPTTLIKQQKPKHGTLIIIIITYTNTGKWIQKNEQDDEKEKKNRKKHWECFI